MEPHELPKAIGKSVTFWNIETLRARVHFSNPSYFVGGRITDKALAEQMAYAEKPHIDTALAHMAIAHRLAGELSKNDDSPYAQIRRYMFQTRIENSTRLAISSVILAEDAASLEQLAATVGVPTGIDLTTSVEMIEE